MKTTNSSECQISSGNLNMATENHPLIDDVTIKTSIDKVEDIGIAIPKVDGLMWNNGNLWWLIRHSLSKMDIIMIYSWELASGKLLQFAMVQMAI